MILDYKNVDILQGQDHVVLQGVNLQINEGDLVYLTGPVGSGKTSLMKTIYGELPIRGEQAQVMDWDMLHLHPSQMSTLRRSLGIVFQDFQLLNDRTVRKNLDFVLRATDWKKKADREQRILEVMNRVKLADKLDKYPYELSGGEQQRVSIARALLNHARFILADEPTGNLDPENGERILAILDEVRRQEQVAILISTHNMQWPRFFPGKVYRCAEGHLTIEQ